jgi:3-deoxy-D-manno-octulosonic-acid transferase
LLVIGSPWLLVGAVRKGKYRTGWAAKFWGQVPLRTSSRPCAWLHAVSLGEVSLIGSLVAEIERRHPDWEIAISTTTLTGYELASKRYAAKHLVFYCPLDFSWAVRRAVARLRPTLLVLVELELWPNLIGAARAAGAKVAIVNGRLSDRSFRGYRRIRPLARWLLGKLDLVAAQNSLYADRFIALGARAGTVHVTGSLKFDGAQTDRDNPVTVRLRELAGIRSDDVVFLVGSTQEPEERLALEAYRQLAAAHPELRLVIVPRHPDRFDEVARMLDTSGLVDGQAGCHAHPPRQRWLSMVTKREHGTHESPPYAPLTWQRRTALDTADADPAARILLVDRIGELAAWWGTAAIAYVGGSMGSRNGQNMIEPAAYGAAVSFGPMTRNFRDVVEALLAAEGAIVVRDGAEMTAFVRRCLEDPKFAAELGARAQRVVASQLGATARTADLLDALVARESNVAHERRSAA